MSFSKGTRQPGQIAIEHAYAMRSDLYAKRMERFWKTVARKQAQEKKHERR